MNYDGQDPIAMGCSGDAYTVPGAMANITDNSGNVIGQVELRYSPSCQTNWCKVTSFVGEQNLIGTIGREDGAAYRTEMQNTAEMYTDMVYAPDPVKAHAIGTINDFSAHTGWF